MISNEVRSAEYEQLAGSFPAEIPDGVRLSVEAGIGHEREWVRFWRRLARR